jgi:glycerol-3-phosphate dehydrogenase
VGGDPPGGRPAVLACLGDRRFDLLVIGAGIVGCRVAYEAAREGLSVALVDSGDYGGTTSSASSKLLHGGLRYLSTGDVRLVRELQSERRAITTRIAPHLVEPLPLVLAVEGRSSGRKAKLAAALPLYATLSGFERPLPRRVSFDRAAALIPHLRREAVSACGVITEVLTHDARLTLATARAARRAGAVSLNYARVIELERLRARDPITSALVEDALTGEQLVVRFRAVVNATGPCIDVVRKLELPGAPPLVRLSKGVHVVVPLHGEWRGGLALFNDTATAIAIPWQGMLMIGATDTPHDESPASLAVDSTDVGQLLTRFADVLPAEQLHAGHVVHAFAGLRVLPLGTVATAKARRRHVVSVGSGGMVSTAGGKLTTHRLIAMDALHHLPVDVRPDRREPNIEALGRRCSREIESLLRACVDPEVASHLIRLYGDDVRHLLAYRDRDAGALDRVEPRGPDVWAQVDFARDEESAVTVDDVVARRTTLTVRGLASSTVVEAVRARLACGERATTPVSACGVESRSTVRDALAT